MSKKVQKGKLGLGNLFALVAVVFAVLVFFLSKVDLAQGPAITGPVEVAEDLQPPPAANATKVVGLFTDSSGQDKYLIQVTLSDGSSDLKHFLYMSPDGDYTKGERILTTFQSQPVIRSSENKGTKYIVAELNGPDDRTTFALFDENGAIIGLDLEAVSGETSGAKVKFGQWQIDSPSQFSLIITMPDGSESEAIFNAEDGSLIEHEM